MKNCFIHKTADVSSKSNIGENCKIWNNAQIREHATIGKNCIISKDVYIDKNVVIGDNVKIQNGVSIFDGVKIGSNVFVGPHTCFTNDLYPRINSEWSIVDTLVEDYVSIGANCTIVCGIIIKYNSIIGAGSVLTKDTRPNFLYLGNPAKPIRKIDF